MEDNLQNLNSDQIFVKQHRMVMLERSNFSTCFCQFPVEAYVIVCYWCSGPPREILQGGTRLLLGPGDRLRLLSKVSDDKQPLFRSLSEFYIIIFLNKLKIVENSPQKMEKSK